MIQLKVCSICGPPRKENKLVARGPFLSREKPLATNHSQRHHNRMKSSLCMFFPFIAILILSSCVQTSIPDQPPSATVLLHNLEIDSDGKARVNAEGKPLLLGMQWKLLNKLPQNQFHHGNRARGTGFPRLIFITAIFAKQLHLLMD